MMENCMEPTQWPQPGEAKLPPRKLAVLTLRGGPEMDR